MGKWFIDKSFLCILAGLITLAVGCNSHINVAGNPYSLLNTAPPLQVQPINYTVSANQFVQLSATGGVSPYTYMVESGVGTVGPSSGLFQASSVTGVVIVLVRDASGLSGTSTITVNGNGPLPGTGTSTSPTTTNCSAMLSAVNIAATDGTSTTISDSIGAEYVADPNDCATYCGSLGATFCMWSPGEAGVSSAECVAWPSTATIYTYSTSWNSYAGSCAAGS